MDLQVDPARMAEGREVGIYVRAKDPEGHWENVDIATLTQESLHKWLRSRGGENLWAENVVMTLLGHEMLNGAHFST